MMAPQSMSPPRQVSALGGMGASLHLQFRDCMKLCPSPALGTPFLGRVARRSCHLQRDVASRPCPAGLPVALR